MPTDWGGSAGGNLAPLIADLGKIRGEQTLRQGQIWGGSLANIGNLIAQAPQREALAQERQARVLELQGLAQDRQLKGLALQREQQGSAALAKAISDPANQGDPEKVYQAVAGAGFPESGQKYLDLATKHAEGLQSLFKAKETQRQVVADTFEGADPNDTAGLQARFGLLHSQGVEVGPYAQLFDQVGPEAAIKQITDTAPKNVDARRAAALKRQEALTTPTKLGPDEVLALPDEQGNSTIVARGLPKDKSAEVETARHNAAMEAIQRMNVGREQAAQAETARHNRATEAANNPLAALQGGAVGTDAAAGNPTGQAVLDKLPASTAAQVKAIAEGRMAFPSGFALKSPYWQSMISLVSQYDPSFDAVNYNARSKTRSDFTSGKAATSVNALNTVAGHLAELSDKADALGNGSMPFVNSVRNWISRQGGSQKVTNFETAKQAVADELTRVYRQAGGSEQDVKNWQASLNAANSPEQLHGAFATISDLLDSKLQALQAQYEQGMGTNDVQMISPKARAALDKLAGRSPNRDTGAGANGVPNTDGGFRVIGVRPAGAK